MTHSRSQEQYDRKKQKLSERQRIHMIVSDASYHDWLTGETVFWQQGIPVIEKDLQAEVGYVPRYAVNIDRCGEVLTCGLRGTFQ